MFNTWNDNCTFQSLRPDLSHIICEKKKKHTQHFFLLSTVDLSEICQITKVKQVIATFVLTAAKDQYTFSPVT